MKNNVILTLILLSIYFSAFNQNIVGYKLIERNSNNTIRDSIFGIEYTDINDLDTVYFTISNGNPNLVNFVESINLNGYNETPLVLDLLYYDNSISDWVVFSSNVYLDCNEISVNSLDDPSVPLKYYIPFHKDSDSKVKIVNFIIPPQSSPYKYLNDCETISHSNIGIIENDSNINIIIYPNPTSNILSIETDFPIRTKYILLNNLGQIVAFDEFQKYTQVDLSKLDDGIYHLKIGQRISKVIKY